MQVFQPISRSLPGMAITCLHSFETKEKIFPWIADSFSFSICASLSNCAAVQWVYFHLWSLILFHLISGDCWPTYCEIFKKNSCLDIVAFLVAEINHFRKFICLFYAVCLCVNGPSNRLHGRMQSQTGCLTFLHCVFLNAVSDCLSSSNIYFYSFMLLKTSQSMHIDWLHKLQEQIQRLEKSIATTKLLLNLRLSALHEV